MMRIWHLHHLWHCIPSYLSNFIVIAQFYNQIKNTCVRLSYQKLELFLTLIYTTPRIS